MTQKVHLLFLQPYSRYRAGETARFSRTGADRILNKQRPTKDRYGRVVRSAIAEEISPQKAVAITARRREDKSPDPEMVRVRFTRQAGRYMRGDIAAFPKDEAEKYVNGWRDTKGQNHPRVAVWADPEPEPEPDPEPEDVDEPEEDGSEDSESEDDDE